MGSFDRYTEHSVAERHDIPQFFRMRILGSMLLSAVEVCPGGGLLEAIGLEIISLVGDVESGGLDSIPYSPLPFYPSQPRPAISLLGYFGPKYKFY